MGRIQRQLRGSAFGTWVAEYMPCRVSVAGQAARWMPRRLAVVNRGIESHAVYRDEVRQAYETYDGGDFLDVGAHVGGYCLALAGKARPGARFIAAEPEGVSFQQLQSNLGLLATLHSEVRFTALFCGVGDGRYVEVTYPMGRDFHPQVRSSDTGTGPRTVTVDSLVRTLSLRPSLIKVDVEGAEFFVLMGMQETLREHRPKVMLEFHPHFQPSGVTEEDCCRMLTSAGYVLYKVVEDGAARRQFWNPPAGVSGSQV